MWWPDSYTYTYAVQRAQWHQTMLSSYTIYGNISHTHTRTFSICFFITWTYKLLRPLNRFVAFPIICVRYFLCLSRSFTRLGRLLPLVCNVRILCYRCFSILILGWHTNAHKLMESNIGWLAQFHSDRNAPAPDKQIESNRLFIHWLVVLEHVRTSAYNPNIIKCLTVLPDQSQFIFVLVAL